MEGKTTIQIELATWRQLQALKLYPGDNFDDVLKRLLKERGESREAAEERRAS